MILTDGICEASHACSLNAAADSDILDLRASGVTFEACGFVDVHEEVARGTSKLVTMRFLASVSTLCKSAASETRTCVQHTPAKAEAQRLRDVRLHLHLKDHVMTSDSDAEVDDALADERGDVRRGQAHGRSLMHSNGCQIRPA